MADYKIKSNEIERKAERIIIDTLDELFRENGFEIVDTKFKYSTKVQTVQFTPACVQTAC